MLNMYPWILKSGPYDVRWEKVEHVKRMLANRMYPVPPKQVAAKIIERMLERGRGNQHWKRIRSSNANGSSGVSEAMTAGTSETNDF